MLNLGFIFDDANRAVGGYVNRLKVVPLPAAVYMMQVDVLNHYRHALSDNLTVTLDKPFLQNSTLGTPYQKWAYFVNENFSMVSFAVHNLLRYTSRLVHEAGCMVTVGQGATGRDYWAKSNAYTWPTSEVRYQAKSVGISVNDDQKLVIARLRAEPHPHPVIMRGVRDGPAEYVRVVTDPAGAEHEEPTDEEEFERATEMITSETIDIRDRARLTGLHARGMAEVETLAASNRAFAATCNTFYASRAVAEPFRHLIKPYWV